MEKGWGAAPHPGKLPGEQGKDCEPTGRLLGQQVPHSAVFALSAWELTWHLIMYENHDRGDSCYCIIGSNRGQFFLTVYHIPGFLY